MTRRRLTTRRRTAGAVALGLCLAFVAGGLPAATALVVADADTGERLLSIPVDDGSEVALAYTHSVEKTPVEEVYVVDGTALEQVRIEFHSYGAGLPSTAAVGRTDDGAFVAYPDRTYPRVPVVPGDVAGHVLRVDGETYDLVALSGGDAVVVSVVERDVADRAARVVDDA